DVFRSQNFFATNPELARLDTGRGLLLLGDGTGKLRAVPGQESGIKVYGEQRGCAVANYDGDGRVDLVVTQNANATRLYHNRRGQPGLRVRLVATPANPAAVGATLRIESDTRKGPLREIHAGSGYWSQDSTLQVMSLITNATHIAVTWPGGKKSRVEIPKNAKEITIDMDGKATVQH